MTINHYSTGDGNIDWYLRTIESYAMPSPTIYRLIPSGDSYGVLVAECDGDETIGEVFARRLAVDGTPTAAFGALNRWLLRAERGARTVRALFATFLPGGLVRLSWAGYHDVYIRQRDGTIGVRHCPAVALGTTYGVTSRDSLSVLGRGDVMLVPNAPLQRLLCMRSPRLEILERTSLDDVPADDGPPSILSARRVSLPPLGPRAPAFSRS